MYFVESMNINLKFFRYMSKSTGIYRDTESIILRTSYVPICKNYSCRLGHLDLLELSKTGTLRVFMTCSTRLAHVFYLSETYVSDVLVSWFT